MYVKLMGPEGAPDDDTRKTFRLFEGVVALHFVRPPRSSDEVNPEWPVLQDKPTIWLCFAEGDPEGFALDGNVYIMNDAGKTIASFGPATIPTELGVSGDTIAADNHDLGRSAVGVTG